jgi:hypothetical protein
MYMNVKMISVEAIPGIGGGGMKENGWGGELVWYIWNIVRTLVMSQCTPT